MMDPSVEDICDELRENHPSTTELDIDLKRRFTCDDELAAVFGDLRHNCTVKTVSIVGHFRPEGLDRARLDDLTSTCIVRLAGTVQEHPTVQKLVFAEDYSVKRFLVVVPAYMGNPGLSKLEFYQVKLVREVVQGLKLVLDCNKLETLEITRCRWIDGLSFSDLFDAFQKTSSLRELRFSFDETTPHDMILEVPHVVRATQSLENLEFCIVSRSMSYIIAHMAKGVTRHRSVKCLTIHFKRDVGLVDEGSSIALRAMLRNSPFLEKLQLQWCDIGHSKAQHLAAGLASRDCNIQKLRLVHCGLGNRQARVISRALSTNRSITKLDLHGNRIGNDGAIALGSMLEQNNVIVTLNLSSNAIGQEGSLALGNALDTNMVLQDIDLSCKPDETVNHHVGDEAAARFAQMLEQHSNVKRIALSGFGAAGLNEFIQRLPNMDGVVKLVLCTVELPPRDRPAIADSLLSAVEQNMILQELELPDIFIHDDRFEAIESRVKYFLDLKKAGRRHDVDGLPLEVWPLILGRNCSDDAIFYFLLRKPEMVRNYRANRKRTRRDTEGA